MAFATPPSRQQCVRRSLRIAERRIWVTNNGYIARNGSPLHQSGFCSIVDSTACCGPSSSASIQHPRRPVFDSRQSHIFFAFFLAGVGTNFEPMPSSVGCWPNCSLGDIYDPRAMVDAWLRGRCLRNPIDRRILSVTVERAWPDQLLGERDGRDGAFGQKLDCTCCLAIHRLPEPLRPRMHSHLCSPYIVAARRCM